MKLFFTLKKAYGVLPLFLAVVACAQPKIEVVGKPVHQYGTVIEGVQDTIKYTFTVKNSGNKPLKIDNVRASCGCTVVDYDTTIAPGKTGSIVQAVKLKGFSGDISKGITVSSNAANQPQLRLTVQATIERIIDSSPTYLRLLAKNRETPLEVTLTTKLKKLDISEVAFTPHSNSRANWQQEGTDPIRFEFDTKGKKGSDDRYTYTLKLYRPEKIPATPHGTFYISTNHPQKKVLDIRGFISE